ncbi:MAG: transporter [Rhodospirillales bacterium]|nr:transporter [Rhodospirillales bacterium]
MRSFAARTCLMAGTAGVCLVHPAFAEDTSMPNMSTQSDDPLTHGQGMMPFHSAPDPAGLAGTRLHKPGQIMFTYRYMHMDMSQLADGDDDLSPKDVATMRNHNAGKPGQPLTWRSAPQNMTVDMHMFGVMAGVTDDLSVMVMLPYVTKQMEMVTFSGMTGTTELGTSKNETSGIGDVAASALYRLYEDQTHHVHMQAGLSFPTGSTTEKGRMLMANGQVMEMRLPYGMQLGTGTYGLLPGLTYWGARGSWNWGAQALGQINLGENDQGYTFGDRAFSTAWGGYSLGLGFSISARLSQTYVGDIDGKDSRVTGPTPTADPNNYGGWNTSAGFGVNYRVADGPLMGLNPGVEVSVPLYQNVNGPQLKEAWTVFAGVRKTFTF